MNDSMQQSRPTTPTHRIIGGLRVFGGNYNEFTRRFATWMGLHTSDAAALVEILFAEDKGVPLSPARLSERISLSSGATSAVLNRLESAGHIIRTHDSTDRRIVTLRTNPAIQEPAIRFFSTLTNHMDLMLEKYDIVKIAIIEEFLEDLKSTMNDALQQDDPQRN